MSVTVKTLVALLASTALSGALAAGPVPTHEARLTARHIDIDRSLTTLYDQSGIGGNGIVSQNFEQSFDAYDCEAADDFIVPQGVRWHVKEIDIIGTYFGGSGPSRSQNLVIYQGKGFPQEALAEYRDLDSADIFGNFNLDLGKGVTLRPGHYWISVQSNQDFQTSGEWGWLAGDGDEVFFKRAVWRNPDDAFATGCSDWGRMSTCLGFERDEIGDLLFSVRGRSHDKA